VPESRTTDPEEFVFWMVRWVSERTFVAFASTGAAGFPRSVLGHPVSAAEGHRYRVARCVAERHSGWRLSVAGADDMLPPRS
jgi:hypothetical protein